ncbi:MAG: Kelch repeat-containing protein [Candidatus Sumerlaeaceae bacterium]
MRQPVQLIIVAALISAGLISNAPAQQPPVFSLAKSGKLPVPTMMHGTAVVGSRVYIFGGNFEQAPGSGGGWINDVYSAPVQGQGTLGEWRKEEPLPERRAYIGNAVQVINNHIYIVGGSVFQAQNSADNGVQSQDVLWTTVGADGKLSTWQKSQPFPGQSVSNTSTCATDKNLFMLGGHNDQIVSDAVLVCDVGEDGAPVNWRQAAKLPTPLWFHGSAILEDRVYVWGGLPTQESKIVSGKVYSAPVGANATIGAWQEEAPLPYPIYSSAFTGFNDYLIGVSGRYVGGLPTNAIWFARLQNKKVTAWQFLNTDLQARLYCALGLDRTKGWVFITGGLDRRTTNLKRGPEAPVVDLVQAFQLTQPTETKLVVAQNPQPAAAPAAAPSAAPANAQVLGLPQALQNAAQQNKKVLAFFYSPEVPACKRTWDQLINTPAFTAATANVVFSAIDISGADASQSYKYGVFKVPSFALLSPTGELLKKQLKVQTTQDLQQLLQ